MSTALTIITEALQELGVYGSGETVSADDGVLCLRALNNLLDAWKIEPLMLYETGELVATLPAATSTLTIGDGEDFDTGEDINRPARIERGSFVRVGELDYPLDVISQAEYNALTMKDIEGPWPCVCVYDAAYPIGTLTFFPEGACEVHLHVATYLTSFAAVTTVAVLPPGYERALALTLCEEVAAKFQRPVATSTVRKAAAARRSIKRANVVVPQLQVGCEPSLPGRYAILGG
jgi:hypothetical protein